jgi:hypothetical protein
MAKEGLTVPEFLFVDYPTYDMMFAGHTNISAYLCRHVIDRVIGKLMGAIARAAADCDIDPSVTMAEARNDVLCYLFEGYKPKG